MLSILTLNEETSVDIPLGRRAWFGRGRACDVRCSEFDSAFCPRPQWTSSWRATVSCRAHKALLLAFFSPQWCVRGSPGRSVIRVSDKSAKRHLMPTKQECFFISLFCLLWFRPLDHHKFLRLRWQLVASHMYTSKKKHVLKSFLFSRFQVKEH